MSSRLVHLIVLLILLITYSIISIAGHGHSKNRILSARTLHFTRNYVPKADYQSLFAALPFTGIDHVIPEFFLGVWHSMIRKYSTTNLCCKEDLLLAIAGVAIRIQKQASLTWSFGLWREYLIREVLWYVRGGTGEPTRERAPSWSWASIELQDAQIIYEPAPPTSVVAKIICLPDVSNFESQRPLRGNEVEYAIKIAGPLM